ncbi:hypothetical protein SUNI508_02305 [Seiridium unicorne]|uniref:Pentatricopeptide repeat-containing protein n=1 Tax=Seiridium unicorne TaxID=138068 RepID=A0ABR2UIK9_9PEZI
MFSCRACTRRALAVLLETPLPSDTSRAPLRKCVSSNPASAARTYATNAVAERGTKPRGMERHDDDTDMEKPKRTVSKSVERTVNRQMEFLNDPFHIAKEVERVLAKDQFEQAALLARNASAKYKVTVAWNHLIDYQMRNFKLHAAIKTFNEMKKRAQLPNAQTYTIIFRGCAMSPHPKLAVAEAFKLYNNMLSSDRISPNTVHLNAMLQVCAKAEDIETMFTIVKSAGHTMRAPNNLTYTTILNAIRAIVDKPQDRTVPTEDRTPAIQQTIQRAKAIWEEVLKKWRDASIAVDEELVCAMGRILLMGNFHDNDAIFSLIEQTMGITKEPEKLSSLAWKGVKQERASLSNDEGIAQVPSTSVQMATKGSPKSSIALVHPGKNSLSMVMTAIENTGKVNLARRYWIVFTKNYDVVPDAHNWFALFRALRRGKSSTKTAEYLAEMPKDMMSVKVFRTAMLTCVRDNLNKSSFNNATRILEIMLMSTRVPDMQALRTYLRVAYANKRLFEEMAEQKDPNAAKLAWGRQMCTALENLWEPYRMAAKQLTHGGLAPVAEKKFVDDQERDAWIREASPRAELSALARKMIAAYDRLIFDNMVPPVVSKRLEPRRNALNRFVVKYFEDREKYEPGWNRKVAELETKKEEEADWDLGSNERW